MLLAERIKEVCRKSHNRDMGVLPPQVCPYCMGCPLGTIVLGVTGGNPQAEPLSISDDKAPPVIEWLDKLEQRFS